MKRNKKYAVAGIITIFIILITFYLLFSIGNPGGPAGLIRASCTANFGYSCTGVIYLHHTGNVVVTIGQSTGTNWGTSAFIYSPQGTAITANAPAVTFANALSLGLYSGNTTTIAFGVSGTSIAVGTTTAGSIWACYTIGTSGIIMTGALGYCTAGTNTVYYTQIATLTAKAT